MQNANLPLGCTTAMLHGFPYDEENSYEKANLEKLAKEVNKPLPASLYGYTRSWIATLCSQQMKAKAILEAAGWRVLAVVPSGHKEKPTSKSCNGGTVYLMGKGWNK